MKAVAENISSLLLDTWTTDLNPDLLGEIQDAVTSVLTRAGRADSWRTYAGNNQVLLQEQLGAILGCPHVGLASSGTAAMEMLLRGFRLDQDDEVLLSAYDYPGTFAAIERAGARPALVDIVPNGWNLNWDSLESMITPKCRVLIASHLHGHLQPIRALAAWCQQRGIRLIHDACQALGAVIEGEPLGHFGDATLVSFGGSKVVSAGRGGAWVTRDEELAQRTRLAGGVGSGAFELSELQAMTVLAQLPFLARVTTQCRNFFEREQRAIEARLPGVIAPWQTQIEETAFYQAGWIMPETMCEAFDSLSQSRHAEIQRVGIGTGFPGYHRRSARRCRIPSSLPNTGRIVHATLTVHHRAALTNAPVAEVLCELLGN